MRLYLTIFLLLVFSHSKSQKQNVEYRTVTEPDLPLHYLIFSDSGKCTLKISLNHGQAMAFGLLNEKPPYNFRYKTENDTTTITADQWVYADSGRLTGRLLKARFISKKDGELYDCNSAYSYFDRKYISDKYIVYVIDGELYRQKISKTNGYGLVKRSFRTKHRLRRKLTTIDIDNYDLRMLRGQEAYLKYGTLGMGGVVEIDKK